MTLKLVKGEFTSLEEALRAQVALMQGELEKRDARIAELEKWEQHCYHCGKHWTECCYE